MPSIYQVNEWSNGTLYRKNQIVSEGGSYYYCVTEHTSEVAGEFPSDNRTLWEGYISDEATGEDKPYFIWLSSYNLSVLNVPRTKNVKFGEGWEQRMSDGLNNTLLEIDVGFENRDLFEISAIAHFLDVRAGTESFIWYAPEPYYAKKLWVCDSHNLTINFYNNYTIRAKFREVVY